MAKRLPLEGIRVVEFCHVVMGPTCGLVLADLGAEVVKVEPLDGDHTRKLVASGAGFFPTYNRNKKSFAVDLKSPQGREVVLKLIASAMRSCWPALQRRAMHQMLRKPHACAAR